MAITTKELAILAKVSRPAVSAALSRSTSSRVSEKTRRKILNLAAKLGYVPNMIARQLKGATSGLVGLLTVPSNLGLLAVFQAELISALQAHGFEVLTSKLRASDTACKAINDFQARQVMGIMALGMDLPLPKPPGNPIPIVYCGRNQKCGYDVGCDVELGGYLAAKHLLGHGRRRLLYLGLDHDKSNQWKFAGVARAAKEAGLKPQEHRMLIVEDGCIETVFAALRKLRSDALLCCNDFVAADMVGVMLRHGIKVPDDIAVTGFDGYSFCRNAPVPLATVVQPVRAQAVRAVEILLERISSGRTGDTFSGILLAPRFHPSLSCSCKEPGKSKLSGSGNILFDFDDFEDSGDGKNISGNEPSLIPRRDPSCPP